MRGSTMRESVTDVRIILECLQEAYQMEGDMVRSGKNIHATMIYPFVRMLQEKCSYCRSSCRYYRGRQKKIF